MRNLQRHRHTCPGVSTKGVALSPQSAPRQPLVSPHTADLKKETDKREDADSEERKDEKRSALRDVSLQTVSWPSVGADDISPTVSTPLHSPNILSFLHSLHDVPRRLALRVLPQDRVICSLP